MPALVRSHLVAASTLLVFTLGWPAAVAAQPQEAARDDRFELPVTGGRAALERLGIRPEERGTALVLLARALHGMSATASSGSLAAVFAETYEAAPTVAQGTPADEPPAAILAPFSDRAWRRALALEDRADLFVALVKTRGALLVASGALQAAPSVRRWLGGDPSLLQRIIRLWPGAFAQAGAALRLEGDRLTVPGGAAYDPAWTALVGVSPARREDFLRQLLARDDGRLARFFAALDRLEEPRRAALLQPLPGEDRTAALTALYRLAKDAESPWHSNVHPFQLSYADLPSVLHAVHDIPLEEWTASGGWWPLLFSSRIRTRTDA
jgi:hypothetical protein